MVSGDDLRGAKKNNNLLIKSRWVMSRLVHVLLHLPHPKKQCDALC